MERGRGAFYAGVIGSVKVYASMSSMLLIWKSVVLENMTWSERNWNQKLRHIE
jgi:hypothetical protein